MVFYSGVIITLALTLPFTCPLGGNTGVSETMSSGLVETQTIISTINLRSQWCINMLKQAVLHTRCCHLKAFCRR